MNQQTAQKQGEKGGSIYTENNTPPSETEPAASWWQGPIRWLRIYSTEIGAASNLVTIVNFGVKTVAFCFNIGQKNVPEAKRKEGIPG